MIIPIVLLLGFLIGAPTVWSTTTEARFKNSLSLISGGEFSKALEVPGNDQNSALKIPSRRLFLEARPDWSLEYGLFQMVLRPRGTYEWSQSDFKTQGSSKTSGKTTESTDAYLSEGFMVVDLSDTTAFTLGRQNYQWGPAESLNPSNFIFHENVSQRSVFFESMGKDIIRLNYTPFKSLSAVALLEFQENKEIKPYGAFNEFRPASLVKIDFSWNGGAEYVGLTAAKSESQQMTWDGIKTSWNSRIAWGEYFNLLFPWIDGLSVYADMGHQKGSAGWYPSLAPQKNLIYYDKKYLEDEKIRTTGVFGLRYDFIDGEILRFEYTRDEHAYSATERSLAVASVTPSSSADPVLLGKNIQHYWNRGIDLGTPEAYLLSLSMPNTLNIKDFWILARSSWEPLAKSSWFYFSTEYQLGDSGTLSYGGMVTGGPKDGGLKGIKSPSHTIAYRHRW
jgi:hypothetical protein